MRDNVKGGVHRLAPLAKSTKERKRGNAISVPAASKGPQYSWGSSVTLDHEDLKKMGVQDLPKVGHHVPIHAKAKVTASSINDSDDDDEPRRSLTLQITHMGMGAPEAPKAPGRARRFTPPKPTPASKFRRA